MDVVLSIEEREEQDGEAGQLLSYTGVVLFMEERQETVLLSIL